jgi:hypothetical protein
MNPLEITDTLYEIALNLDYPTLAKFQQSDKRLQKKFQNDMF